MALQFLNTECASTCNVMCMGWTSGISASYVTQTENDIKSSSPYTDAHLVSCTTQQSNMEWARCVCHVLMGVTFT